MVSTPRSHATTPRAPASRAQPSTQTPPRPSRPLQQQASKNPNTDSSMLNSARKTYKEAFARGVPLPKPRATKNLAQAPNHTGADWNFKFVTKLNPRDSPPRELLEEQTALLFQQVASGNTSLKVFTGDALADYGRASYRQVVMTPAFGGRARPVYKDASTQTTFAASNQADNVRLTTSAPHHGAFFRDLAAPFVALSAEGQLADPQKQNAALTKQLGKAIAGQTPKSDNELVQNTAAGNSVLNLHAALLVRPDSHAVCSIPNDMQAKENA